MEQQSDRSNETVKSGTRNGPRIAVSISSP